MMKIFMDIDSQSDFMNEDGALYVPDAEDIKPLLKKLTKLAKEEKITIVKTMDWHNGSEPEFIKNGGPFPFHCMQETPGSASIIETSAKGAVRFEKQCYDVFDKKLGNKNIAGWLKDNNVTEAWVYGVATDYCVKAAVLGLRKLGINTYVFENAIAGVDPLTTEEAIKEMKEAGAHFAVAKL
jgi:nicotinamidase/pyrazinamidase